MKARIVLSILFLAAVSCVDMQRFPIGSIKIDVEPDDCIVYVNGARAGIADDFDGWPGDLDLKPGTYELEFRLDGYETYKTTAKVEAWETTKIKYTLNRVVPSVAQEEKVEENREKIEPSPTPDVGRLSLRVTPENAVIYLDGRLLATAADLARTHAPLQIPPGKHIMVSFAPDHEDDTREFDLKPGEFLELEIVLQEK